MNQSIKNRSIFNKLIVIIKFRLNLISMDFTFPNFSLDNLFVSEPRPEDLHSFIMNTHINKYSQIQNLVFINRTRYSNMRDTGCYIVIVNAFEESGPNAIFCISKI